LGGWSGDAGSDRFTTKIVNGPTLLDHTLSNATGTQNFPAAGSPPKAGAVAVDTLGSYGGAGSAIYHFEHTFDHWQPGLQVDFTGIGLSAGSGQYWGVDNIDIQLERLLPDLSDFQIGDTAAGSIESPGAEDLHAFSVPVGGADLFLDWVLCGFYNPHLQILNSSGTPVSFGGVSTLGCNDRFGTLPAGDYTLRVFQPEGSYGAYSFKLWTVPDPQSFTHTIGDTISDQVPAAGAGRLESPGAEDLHAFSVPVGGADLFLDWVLCGFYNPHLQILNSSGTPVSFGGVSTLGCNDRFGTLPAGDYTLRVFQPEGSYGAYSFKLWTVPDPQSFTHTIGDTVSNGVPAAGAGNVESPGAADLFQFTVPAGGATVFLDLTQCFGGIFTQILNSAGSAIYTNGCNDSSIALPQGEYTFKVYSDWGYYGAYGFKMTGP
jgi:hypothetical protein